MAFAPSRTPITASGRTPSIPSSPHPRPASFRGGPNSDLQDPYSKGLHPHCIGQTCYVDHIEAYSANEECINWNAALSWLAAYLNATL